MFELLEHRPPSPEPVSLGATVSLLTHAAFLLSLAVGTGDSMAPPDEVRHSLVETAIRYLLPPNNQRASSSEHRAEWSPQRVGQFQLPPIAVKDGTPTPVNTGAGAVEDEAGTTPLPLAEEASAQDAFTLVDVDSVALRDPTSAAPAYPPRLQERGVEGTVVVRFVVDTTGRADPETFNLVKASHPLFGAAVRDAVPGMKFLPARMGAVKVRQLVELPFTFRIIRSAAQLSATKP